MREYEVMVVYDLAVAEAGGGDAAPQQLTQLLESRGGKVLKVDHWGRRRLAYPINRALDGDYVLTRVELEPAAVRDVEGALKINERVYRHLVVRADELPVPPPPREPRPPRAEEPAEEGAVAEAPAATVEAPAAPAEQESAEEPAAAGAPAAEAPGEDGEAEAAGSGQGEATQTPTASLPTGSPAGEDPGDQGPHVPFEDEETSA
jgi:small subunit ribosomal protein S6